MSSDCGDDNRFSVIYHLVSDYDEARVVARDICVEQTVEFPDELIEPGYIRDCIIGHIESIQEIDGNRFEVEISYSLESAAFELTQLINVIFGNISIKPGIRVHRLLLSDGFFPALQGPRFGRDGIRAILDVNERPLIASALKPMGLSAEDLAEMAFNLALGGIDIIKDDHGISDQKFSPFQKRVELCSDAVNRANNETGHNCIYMSNITSPADQLHNRATFACDAGAGGLLIAPGLVGFDSMRVISEDERINLPLMSHPTFQGTYVVNRQNGISHYVLFGQLNRLAGADTCVFPNFGGRFSFTRDECSEIAEATEAEMGIIKTIFPAPGGGMNLDSIPGMIDTYGREVILLIGGALHKSSRGLVESCRKFRRLIEEFVLS